MSTHSDLTAVLRNHE